ncbi:MAG: UDP-N-acetylmuramate dehydrogenase [Bdellovibrionaceae bacterium]|nr:UDP-N-acetylmuramate dehydrogenase [Pseudobdellovibrionaceae bacterium]
MSSLAAVDIEDGVRLSSYTSWQTGGVADHLALPKTIEGLRAAVAWACEHGLSITVLGGGTNVLVSDAGIRGLTIGLKHMTGSSVVVDDGRLIIECLAGTSKSELLKIFLKHKLQPALFLAGLPGDVGGGIVMNAGVGEKITPREFVEITDWVEVLRWTQNGDSEIVRFRCQDLQWRYRHCQGWEPGILVRAGLSWPMQVVPEILTIVRQANLTRAQKQPLDMPSCGSVFINPPGHTSGRLIESAGLKGYTVGGAKVSEKHANFIVNFSKATSADIDAVIKHVQKVVLETSGVQLKTEVVYLGQW